MKVLLIHRDIGVGSVGRIVDDLYHGFKKAKHECKIAYGFVNKSEIEDTDLFQVSSKTSIKVHALVSRITDKCGYYSYKQTKKLIKFIEKFQPDVVNIHGLYGYWINIKLLLNYLASTNIHVIFTLHSCWDFTGHCCYFTYAKCEKWKTLCQACTEKRKYPASYFFDNSANNYLLKKQLYTSLKKCSFIAPSRWMLNCFKESFLKEYNCFLITNGIDLSSFHKTDLDLAKYNIPVNKKIVLGVASNWEERKGLNDFLELSKIVSSSYLIILVGLTQKQIKKMPSNIIGIKKTNSKSDLAGLYSCAVALFNPTYEDNYPTVNLEAIACGTPVITYPTGGSGEIIEQLKFGCVVNYKDFNSVKTKLDELVDKKPTVDENDRISISNNKMVERYISLFLNQLEN